MDFFGYKCMICENKHKMVPNISPKRKTLHVLMHKKCSWTPINSILPPLLPGIMYPHWLQLYEDMQSLPLGGDVGYHFMLNFTSQIILLSPKPSILPSFYSIFSIKQPMQGTFIIPYLKNWIFEFLALKLKIY